MSQALCLRVLAVRSKFLVKEVSERNRSLRFKSILFGSLCYFFMPWNLTLLDRIMNLKVDFSWGYGRKRGIKFSRTQVTSSYISIGFCAFFRNGCNTNYFCFQQLSSNHGVQPIIESK